MEVSYLSHTGSRTIRDWAAQFAIGLGLMVFGLTGSFSLFYGFTGRRHGGVI